SATKKLISAPPGGPGSGVAGRERGGPEAGDVAPRRRCQRGYVMDDVAEGGGLDERDVGHRQKHRRSRAASAGLSAVANPCMHAPNRTSPTSRTSNARR